jgi:hypothetical protein
MILIIDIMRGEDEIVSVYVLKKEYGLMELQLLSLLNLTLDGCD